MQFRVAMEDGVCLATDVYLPPHGQPAPVLLERTPYGKCLVSRSERIPGRDTPLSRPELAQWFARQGYVVVMQDCRGRHDSEGEFVKYVNEASDGLKTMQWLVEQSWCDGRIATMGLSYGAHTQLAAACMNPPGLACMFMDSGGFSSAYHGGIRRGGAFELKQATWAYRHAFNEQINGNGPAVNPDSRSIKDWFRDMPWWPGHSPLAAAPEFEQYLFDQWRAGIFNEAWQRPGLYAEGYYEQVPDVPVAIVGSWYDPYALACVTHFQRLGEGKRRHVRLLMGPWTHGDRSQSWAGEVDFGPDAVLESSIAESYLHYRLSWFDRCLGSPGAVDDFPPVWYFRMGGGDGHKDSSGRLRHGGSWQSAQQWPPAGLMHELFLHSNGTLLTRAPENAEDSISFTHDPGDPVPTLGGTVTSGDPVMHGGAFDQRIRPDTFTYRPDTPRVALAQREDVLVFETAPLEAPMDVSGTVSAELWVSSDCPDTDITLKLVDVYPPSEDFPQGFAMNIADGILRLRFRKGFDHEEFLEPGQVEQVTIETFPSSNLFCKGHRLRIEIAGSNYPQFDLNFNDGSPQGHPGNARTATNTIHCDASRPSNIRLPLVNGRES